MGPSDEAQNDAEMERLLKLKAMRSRNRTEWTKDELEAFRSYLSELGEPAISATGYTKICTIVEMISDFGLEGNWEEIDLKTIQPIASDGSRKATNLIIRVLLEDLLAQRRGQRAVVNPSTNKKGGAK
jgi:hypothetical protein